MEDKYTTIRGTLGLKEDEENKYLFNPYVKLEDITFEITVGLGTGYIDPKDSTGSTLIRKYSKTIAKIIKSDPKIVSASIEAKL